MALGGRGNDLFGFGGPPTSSDPGVNPAEYFTPPPPGGGWFGGLGGPTPSFGGFTGVGGVGTIPESAADPYVPTGTVTSGGATSVGDSVRKRHGRRDRGQTDGRARPPGRGASDTGLSPAGRVLVGCLIGGVLARSFETPGGWALGSTAGGLAAYFGGELWMTR